MNKTDLVKRWVRKTGAQSVVGSRDQAFAMGWKLLNGYLYFKETGRYYEDDQEMYDYTCFIHEFAHRTSGTDEELYGWLVKYGTAILDDCPRESACGEIPNTNCPLCGKRLSQAIVARHADEEIFISVAGRAWCRDCYKAAQHKKWNIS